MDDEVEGEAVWHVDRLTVTISFFGTAALFIGGGTCGRDGDEMSESMAESVSVGFDVVDSSAPVDTITDDFASSASLLRPHGSLSFRALLTVTSIGLDTNELKQFCLRRLSSWSLWQLSSSLTEVRLFSLCRLSLRSLFSVSCGCVLAVKVDELDGVTDADRVPIENDEMLVAHGERRAGELADEIETQVPRECKGDVSSRIEERWTPLGFPVE